MPTSLCADFSFLPDNTYLPNNFTIGGYEFTEAKPGTAWFINKSAGQVGLQFPSAGITIKLPFARDDVSLVIGSFGGSITAEATDSNGNIITVLTTIADNIWTKYILHGTDILFVRLSGGNDEGAIQTICISINEIP